MEQKITILKSIYLDEGPVEPQPVSVLTKDETPASQDAMPLKNMQTSSLFPSIKSMTNLKSPRHERSKSKNSKRSFGGDSKLPKAAHEFVTLADTIKRLSIKKHDEGLSTGKLESPDDSVCQQPGNNSHSQANRDDCASSQHSTNHKGDSAKARHDTCSLL